MLLNLTQSISRSQAESNFARQQEQWLREKCTEADLHIINQEINQTNIFGRIYISDSELAGNSVTRETVNRRKWKLHDDGVHYVREGEHRRPTIAYLHPLFFTYWFRQRIKDILPNAAIIPKIALLLAVTINNKITSKIDNISKVTPFKKLTSSSQVYIYKQASSSAKKDNLPKEEEILPRKIYKDVISLTNRKPPDIKVDNVNKNELLAKIKNREALIPFLEAAYAKSAFWKTEEQLAKAKEELMQLKEQYDRAN